MSIQSSVLFFAAAALATAGIVEDVRTAIDHQDFRTAQAMLNAYTAHVGNTPEAIEAVSWLGRGSLKNKDYDNATKFAQQAYDLSLNALKKRPLDQEPHLPLAIGAAIEVHANVMAAQGERTEAVTYLRGELKKYYATSIRTRIQKNINLLNLEGKPAPALAGLPQGKPAILFFWAHWCPDCKLEAPILKRIREEFAAQGLTIVPTTQKYGYVAGGEDAPPAVETAYIEKIRQQYYSAVVDAPARVSEEAFRSYGASTTPTLVLVDKHGVVKTYHPGAMTYEELRAKIPSLF